MELCFGVVLPSLSVALVVALGVSIGESRAPPCRAFYKFAERHARRRLLRLLDRRAALVRLSDVSSNPPIPVSQVDYNMVTQSDSVE